MYINSDNCSTICYSYSLSIGIPTKICLSLLQWTVHRSIRKDQCKNTTFVAVAKCNCFTSSSTCGLSTLVSIGAANSSIAPNTNSNMWTCGTCCVRWGGTCNAQTHACPAFVQRIWSNGDGVFLRLYLWHKWLLRFLFIMLLNYIHINVWHIENSAIICCVYVCFPNTDKYVRVSLFFEH